MNSNLEPKPTPSEDQTLPQNSGTSSPVCPVHGVKLEEGLGSRFCPVCLLQFSTADDSSAPDQSNKVQTALQRGVRTSQSRPARAIAFLRTLRWKSVRMANRLS